MLSTSNHADVIVIGAGISGLLAAVELQTQGKQVLVLERSNSVGGRLSTRRVGKGIVDHGAQFFTVTTEAFQAFTDRWLEDKVTFLWSLGWSDGSLADVTDEDYPLYAAHGGMNALAKHIAKPLENVRTSVEVQSIQPHDNGWRVTDTHAQTYTADAVVITVPVPQALALIDAGSVNLQAEDRAALEKIKYEQCLTGIFVFDSDVRLPVPGAVQRRNAPISWIANNKQKGISQNETIITVQASGDYSAQLWNDPDPRILNALRTDLMVYIPDGHEIVEEQLKRWIYSSPSVIHPEATLKAQGVPTLIFAGDAFGDSGIEGAALSGLAAAAALA